MKFYSSTKRSLSRLLILSFLLTLLPVVSILPAAAARESYYTLSMGSSLENGNVIVTYSVGEDTDSFVFSPENEAEDLDIYYDSENYEHVSLTIQLQAAPGYQPDLSQSYVLMHGQKHQFDGNGRVQLPYVIGAVLVFAAFTPSPTSGTTATPGAASTTVTASANNTEAQVALSNGASYQGRPVTATVYSTGSTYQVDPDVSASYADGVITLFFDPPITQTSVYNVTLTEQGMEESAPLEVTIIPGSIKTQTPVSIGGMTTVVCEQGNQKAMVKVSNADAFPNSVTVTVYDSDGEVADGVNGIFEDGWLILTFDPPLAEKTLYYISFTMDGFSESQTTELTVQPVTTTPRLYDPVDNVLNGATEAVFIVDNEDDYGLDSEITVYVYDSTGNSPAEGITGSYGNGSLFLESETGFMHSSVYKVAFQEDGFAPSGMVTAEVIVVQQTERPVFEGGESVTVQALPGNMQATVPLANIYSYPTTMEGVTVYMADGITPAPGVSATFAYGSITLYFSSPLTKTTTFMVTLTESGYGESDPVSITVEPVNTEDDSRLFDVKAQIGTITYTGIIDSDESGTGGTVEYPVVYKVTTNLPVSTVSLSFQVAFGAHVEYQASAGPLVEWPEKEAKPVEPEEDSPTVETIHIEDLDLDTLPYLYLRIMSANTTSTTYYRIMFSFLNLEAVEGTNTYSGEGFPNSLGVLDGNEILTEDAMNNAALAAASANAALLSVLENQGSYENPAEGTIWGMLKENIRNIEPGDLTFYLITYLANTVTAYNEDAKSVTVDITPVYDVVASTATSADQVSEVSNAVTVVSGLRLPLQNVQLSIQVPASIAEEEESVYLQHKTNGWYEYTVENDAITTKVDTFSPFMLQGTPPGPAEYRNRVYDSVQAAVDAVANNGTIIILQEYSSSVTVYRPVVFKIKDPDKLFTGGVYSGPGYALHVDVGSDGTNTYTVTKIGVTPVPGAKTLADFVDLNPDAWYACGVEYALQKGLMEGVTGTEFDPDATTTRAMMVTMLYRAAGKPASTGTVSFKDVPANAWFAKAIEWAASNGLVNGYSKDTFAPNDPITREQMATLLFRYASYRHDNVKARASLSSFEDADRISSWAVPAFRWADASGLIRGLTDHMLDLRADSTRAQVAELMMRFETDMERK